MTNEVQSQNEERVAVWCPPGVSNRHLQRMVRDHYVASLLCRPLPLGRAALEEIEREIESLQAALQRDFLPELQERLISLMDIHAHAWEVERASSSDEQSSCTSTPPPDAEDA